MSEIKSYDPSSVKITIVDSGHALEALGFNARSPEYEHAAAVFTTYPMADIHIPIFVGDGVWCERHGRFMRRHLHHLHAGAVALGRVHARRR